MKILYYNWVPFDWKRFVGGGVQVYQKNILEHLVNDNKDDEIYFLSSGFKYNPIRKKSYIRKSRNVFGKKIKSFEIINSPIVSPMVFSGGNIKEFTENQEIVETFERFVNRCGGFDVIHINNFEGLTPACLRIKETFPNTKIIFSVHNYASICPRVQYFQEFSSRICHNFHNGAECVRCFMGEPCARFIKKERIYNYFDGFHLPHLLSKILMRLFWFNINHVFPHKNKSKENDYCVFRQKNIEFINKYVDSVLAVSQRVADICIKHGIDADKVKVSYIGTKFAEMAQYKNANTPTPNQLTIAYLGYARNDKGYFFLLDALATLPSEYADRLNIVIAAKEAPMLAKISNLKSVKVYNGYSHDKLSQILSGVDLGVVPVIWEDNLPQVAIEMFAHGVPVLASSFGGASELCNNNKFRFNGGEIADFHRKLISFIDNPEQLHEYYPNARRLLSMKQHLQELCEYYK